MRCISTISRHPTTPSLHPNPLNPFHFLPRHPFRNPNQAVSLPSSLLADRVTADHLLLLSTSPSRPLSNLQPLLDHRNFDVPLPPIPLLPLLLPALQHHLSMLTKLRGQYLPLSHTIDKPDQSRFNLLSSALPFLLVVQTSPLLEKKTMNLLSRKARQIPRAVDYHLFPLLPPRQLLPRQVLPRVPSLYPLRNLERRPSSPYRQS